MSVPQVPKSGKVPNWEVSYNRFLAGEHPQAIAMLQESGKPIQVWSRAKDTTHTHTQPTHALFSAGMERFSVAFLRVSRS